MARTSLLALAIAAAIAAPISSSAEDQPGTFKLPGTNTTIRPYGFIEINATYDFSGRGTFIESNDWATYLPVQPFKDATPKKQLYVTARTSRFGLATSTPTALGEVGTKLELDFNSPSPNNYSSQLTTNGNTFRLRHAYATVGGFLVGQNWSTFMDLDALPETVDFNIVGSVDETRQPMLRYTYTSGGSSLALALENAFSRNFMGVNTGFAGNNGNPPNYYSVVPDVVGSYSYGGKWGHVSARGVAITYSNFASKSRKTGYGLGLSGHLAFLGDTLVWGAQGGSGIGRYMFNTLLQGGLDDGTDLRFWNALGYHVGLTHVWSAAIRSNVIVSQTLIKQDSNAANGQSLADFAVANGATGDLEPNKRIDELVVNIFVNLAPNVSFGLEYHYGKRVTFSTNEGVQNRINAVFNVKLM